MNKGKHIQKLTQKVVDLQDELYFRDRVYATKKYHKDFARLNFL